VTHYQFFKIAKNGSTNNHTKSEKEKKKKKKEKKKKKKKSIAGQTHVLGLVGRKHLKTYWP
jgi:hypothetical protein